MKWERVQLNDNTFRCGDVSFVVSNLVQSLSTGAEELEKEMQHSYRASCRRMLLDEMTQSAHRYAARLGETGLSEERKVECANAAAHLFGAPESPEES